MTDQQLPELRITVETPSGYRALLRYTDNVGSDPALFDAIGQHVANQLRDAAEKEVAA